MSHLVLPELQARLDALLDGQATYLSSDDFARALGWDTWYDAWRAPDLSKAGATPTIPPPPPTLKPVPPPPPGASPSTSPGPNVTGHAPVAPGTHAQSALPHNGQGGHWVTIHGHAVFIDDNGAFHFGGPQNPGIDPKAGGFSQAIHNQLSTGTPTHVSGNIHSYQVHSVNGLTATMTYQGKGWKVELKDANNNILQTQKVVGSAKAGAVAAAHKLITDQHSNALAAYSQHHVATVANAALTAQHQQAVAAAAAAAAKATAIPSVQAYHASVKYGARTGNVITATAPNGAGSVKMTYTGNGWRLEYFDANGTKLATHNIKGPGTDYAKAAAAMMLHAHEYGTGATLPAGAGKTVPTSQQNTALAYQHAGLSSSSTVSPAAQATAPSLAATPPPKPIPPPPAPPPSPSVTGQPAPGNPVVLTTANTAHLRMSNTAAQAWPSTTVNGQHVYTDPTSGHRITFTSNTNNNFDGNIQDARGTVLATFQDAGGSGPAIGAVFTWAENHASGNAAANTPPSASAQSAPAPAPAPAAPATAPSNPVVLDASNTAHLSSSLNLNVWKSTFVTPNVATYVNSQTGYQATLQYNASNQGYDGQLQDQNGVVLATYQGASAAKTGLQIGHIFNWADNHASGNAAANTPPAAPAQSAPTPAPAPAATAPSTPVVLTAANAGTLTPAPGVAGGSWSHAYIGNGYTKYTHLASGSTITTIVNANGFYDGDVADAQGNVVASFQDAGNSGVAPSIRQIMTWAENRAGPSSPAAPAPAPAKPTGPIKHTAKTLAAYLSTRNTNWTSQASQGGLNTWANQATGYSQTIQRPGYGGRSYTITTYDPNGTVIATASGSRRTYTGLFWQATGWADAHAAGTLPGAATKTPRTVKAKQPNQAIPGPGNVPSNPGGASSGDYQPPTPKLVTTQAYAGTASAQAFTSSINHTLVAHYNNDVTKLDPKDWTASTVNNDTSGHAASLTHKQSGYQVVARWQNGAPGSGGSGVYRIDVEDTQGNVISSYDSQAARDATYVTQRATQVAHWVDDEWTKKSAQARNGSQHAPIAQFAHYYASQATKSASAGPAFKLGDNDWTDPANQGAVKAHLASQFPKLLGARQNGPHDLANGNKIDPIDHTMNVVNPLNIHTSGLSSRDAELLRLGLVYHDVGKQHGATDPNHPRLSVADASTHLWAHNLTPDEHRDVQAVITWHDAYGNAMKAAGSSATARDREAAHVAKQAYEYTDANATPAQRATQAERINDLLMRAWQSDLGAIPGLTAKSNIPHLQNQVYGSIDVDKDGPAFSKLVAKHIQAQSSGTLPAPLPLPAKPPITGTGAPPNLVAPGLKWGELVQRHQNLPVGPQVPMGTTVSPPQEVYDEARANPDLNYARVFHMAYDGPTGNIIHVHHGSSPQYASPIAKTGIRAGNPGRDNAFGHGIYVVANGSQSVPRGYNGGALVQAELHTGRTIEVHDLDNRVVPAWKARFAKQARGLSNAQIRAAAALDAGYSTISVDYARNGANPTYVVLDPSRIHVTKIVDGSNPKKGLTVQGKSGPIVSQGLTSDEISTPAHHPSYQQTRNGAPVGYTGKARTS